MSPPTRTYAEVVVTLPVEGRYHYAVPDGLDVRVGHRVRVPFGRRRVTGFVVSLADPPDDLSSIKAIDDVLDGEPLISEDLMEIVTFASEYYLEPAGEILRVALPPGLTAGSVSKLRGTDLGKACLQDVFARGPDGEPLADAERAILTAALKGQGVRSTGKAAERRLLAMGRVRAHSVFDARRSDEGVEVVEIIAPRGATLDRAPAQRALYDALTEGPVTVEALQQRLGTTSMRRALRALVQRKLVRRHRVSTQFAPVAAPRPPKFELTPAQQRVLTPILEGLHADASQAFLLRGVTGSGKTEIYLDAIAEARRQGKGALVLVPEIALTSQLEARFSARFGRDVAVLHSAMTDRDRRESWLRLHRGAARIALGPRSAVWAPVRDLGIIVVDEEHDGSFKQSADVRYHGRDLALLRAHRGGAVVVLGSATPSLEAQHMVETDRMTELRLAERVHERPMPEVSVVDMAAGLRDLNGEIPLLSSRLSDALVETIERGEQAIVFLNRRGFNTIVVCDECGEARTCDDCTVSLTHHKHRGLLVCHYCGRTEPLEQACAGCGERAMKPYGAGTERIAEMISRVVPDATVVRLDRDVTARAGALQDTLQTFRERRADILVGTQMVAKGHDFPMVTLVGIVCADASLAFPDFRAAERTFQLLTQVAGRAGRAERPGRVIVQTFQPGHYALSCALHHDDQRFFEIESAVRRRNEYPPFSRLGIIRIEGDDPETLGDVARQVAKLSREACDAPSMSSRGPAPAPIERIKGRYRRMVLLRAPTPARLSAAMRQVKRRLGRTTSRVTVLFDVDATDLL